MIPTPETHPYPPVAKTVVWRHPCDCATASRPLEPGEEPEHRFDVDGEPFPWYIAENGASFRKHGDYYLVRVAIFPIEQGGNRDILDVTISSDRMQPRIGDRLFPWAILGGSISVEVDEDSFPVLHLTFIAEQVDADIEVPELDIWSARTPHEAELERRTRKPREHRPGDAAVIAPDVAPIDEGRAASIEAENDDLAAAVNAPDLDLAIDAAEERNA